MWLKFILTADFLMYVTYSDESSPKLYNIINYQTVPKKKALNNRSLVKDHIIFLLDF